MLAFVTNDLLDLFHLTYIVISLIATFLILYVAHKTIHKQQSKDLFLKFWGLLTFILHISTLWYQFLRGENAVAADNMLFPIYYCNLMMLLLMIVSFYSNKQSKVFKQLATVVAYGGTIGALISLFYPEYYVSGSGFDFPLFKSFLSHSTMMVGSLYLITENYFTVNTKNTISFIASFLPIALIGLAVNLIFKGAGLGSPNAMYLDNPPIEEVPFLNAYVIAFLMATAVFIYSFLHSYVRKKHNFIKSSAH